MNELPDELWWSEQTASASDVDDLGLPFTTDESVLLVALGVLTIVSSCVVMGCVAATVGWSTILILRRRRAGMLDLGKMNGVSRFTNGVGSGYGY